MASEAPDLQQFLPALRDFLTWLEKAQVPGVLIGAIAAGLLSKPRLTTDIDAVVMVPQEHWPEFLSQGKNFGFVPRMSDGLTFAAKRRVLLMRHEPSGIELDISFGALPFEQEMIARATRRKVEGLHLPLPTPEDLIILKAVAHRLLDLGDIERLMDANPQLDLARIRHWLGQFAELLEEPEIVEDFEKVVTRCRR